MEDSLYTGRGEEGTVLCPELYRKLMTLSNGDVVVANHGESMQIARILNRTTGRNEDHIVHSGEYYRVHCLFCGDTRHRLWINHMYGHADSNGRPMRYLATCFNDGCLQDADNWARFDDLIYGFKNANERSRPQFFVREGRWEDPSLQVVEAPGQVIPVTKLPRQHPAAKYMFDERRYTAEMLDRYNIGYCNQAPPRYRTAQGRIVFPIYMHEELVGWQCRHVGDANWSTTPKYYGMPGMRKGQMLYNFDRAKHYPYVVVLEGPTDSNVVGDASVAILGKSLSRRQKELLIATWDRCPIVIVLDPGTQEESRMAITDLVNIGTNPVVNVELPDGYDPADYGRDVVWGLIMRRCNEVGVSLPTSRH